MLTAKGLKTLSGYCKRKYSGKFGRVGALTMAHTNEHGRLIAAAAKAALVPLGCVRKGQSRVWYSDQRFWVIAIEFQPSGWSKGTYLNIFIGWLWTPGPGYSTSYRPVDFIPFENAEQFAPLVTKMAAIAAIEVQKLKNNFKSFSDILDHIKKHANRDSWPIYNAAVACGLAGDIAASRQYFDQMAAWPTYGYDWQLKLKADSAVLASLLDEPANFRAAVLTLIEKRRHLMRLPPDPHCLDELDSASSIQE